MTRYKTELRRRGHRLECDYACLPSHGVETIRTEIIDTFDGPTIVLTTVTNTMGIVRSIFSRALNLVRTICIDDQYDSLPF